MKYAKEFCKKFWKVFCKLRMNLSENEYCAAAFEFWEFYSAIDAKNLNADVNLSSFLIKIVTRKSIKKKISLIINFFKFLILRFKVSSIFEKFVQTANSENFLWIVKNHFIFLIFFDWKMTSFWMYCFCIASCVVCSLSVAKIQLK